MKAVTEDGVDCGLTWCCIGSFAGDVDVVAFSIGLVSNYILTSIAVVFVAVAAEF